MKEKNRTGNGLFWSDLNPKNKFLRTLYSTPLLIINTLFYIFNDNYRDEFGSYGLILFIGLYIIGAIQLYRTYTTWKKQG